MLIACVCICFVLAMMVPFDMFASTTDRAFGGDEISKQADTVKSFLFGAPMRFAGILGGAYGVLQAVLTSSMKPFIVYGGIGMAVNIVPKFIDGVFSILLP